MLNLILSLMLIALPHLSSRSTSQGTPILYMVSTRTTSVTFFFAAALSLKSLILLLSLGSGVGPYGDFMTKEIINAIECLILIVVGLFILRMGTKSVNAPLILINPIKTLLFLAISSLLLSSSILLTLYLTLELVYCAYCTFKQRQSVQNPSLNDTLQPVEFSDIVYNYYFSKLWKLFAFLLLVIIFGNECLYHVAQEVLHSQNTLNHNQLCKPGRNFQVSYCFTEYFNFVENYDQIAKAVELPNIGHWSFQVTAVGAKSTYYLACLVPKGGVPTIYDWKILNSAGEFVPWVTYSLTEWVCHPPTYFQQDGNFPSRFMIRGTHFCDVVDPSDYWVVDHTLLEAMNLKALRPITQFNLSSNWLHLGKLKETIVLLFGYIKLVSELYIVWSCLKFLCQHSPYIDKLLKLLNERFKR